MKLPRVIAISAVTAALLGPATVAVAPSAHAATPATCAGGPCPWPLTPSDYASSMATAAQTIAAMHSASPQAQVVGDVQAGAIADTDTVTCRGPLYFGNTSTGLYIDDTEVDADGLSTVPAENPAASPWEDFYLCFDNTSRLWYSRYIAYPGATRTADWVGVETNNNLGWVLGYNYGPVTCLKYGEWCPILSASAGGAGPNEGMLVHCVASNVVTLEWVEAEMYASAQPNVLYPQVSGKYYEAAGVLNDINNYNVPGEC